MSSSDPYQLLHDHCALSWDDVNAIAAVLGHFGLEIAAEADRATPRYEALLAVAEAARVVCDPMVQDGGGDRWWSAHDDLARALAALDAVEEPR